MLYLWVGRVVSLITGQAVPAINVPMLNYGHIWVSLSHFDIWRDKMELPVEITCLYRNRQEPKAVGIYSETLRTINHKAFLGIIFRSWGLIDM